MYFVFTCISGELKVSIGIQYILWRD